MHNRPVSEQLIEICGGSKLSGGRVSIAGSSNQVTKCIIAALLTDEPVLIKGAPDVNERAIVEEMFSAIGGQGGDPTPSTFPLRYEIDYIRVYQTPAQQALTKAAAATMPAGR